MKIEGELNGIKHEYEVPDILQYMDNIYYEPVGCCDNINANTLYLYEGRLCMATKYCKFPSVAIIYRPIPKPSEEWLYIKGYTASERPEIYDGEGIIYEGNAPYSGHPGIDGDLIGKYRYILTPVGNEKSYPNARDCEHGHQRGKCLECELDDTRTENNLLLSFIARDDQKLNELKERDSKARELVKDIINERSPMFQIEERARQIWPDFGREGE